MAGPGLPVEVTRTYDSRDRNKVGDFGFGWTLSIRNARVQQTMPIGQYWGSRVRTTNIGPIAAPDYSRVPTRASVISVLSAPEY